MRAAKKGRTAVYLGLPDPHAPNTIPDMKQILLGIVAAIALSISAQAQTKLWEYEYKIPNGFHGAVTYVFSGSAGYSAILADIYMKQLDGTWTNASQHLVWLSPSGRLVKDIEIQSNEVSYILSVSASKVVVYSPNGSYVKSYKKSGAAFIEKLLPLKDSEEVSPFLAVSGQGTAQDPTGFFVVSSNVEDHMKVVRYSY